MDINNQTENCIKLIKETDSTKDVRHTINTLNDFIGKNKVELNNQLLGSIVDAVCKRINLASAETDNVGNLLDFLYSLIHKNKAALDKNLQEQIVDTVIAKTEKIETHEVSSDKQNVNNSHIIYNISYLSKYTFRDGLKDESLQKILKIFLQIIDASGNFFDSMILNILAELKDKLVIADSEQNLNKILDKICAKQCYYTTIYNLGHFTGILTDKNLNNIVDSVCEATKYGDVPELDFLSTQFKTKLTYEHLEKIVNTSIERKIDEKSLFGKCSEISDFVSALTDLIKDNKVVNDTLRNKVIDFNCQLMKNLDWKIIHPERIMRPIMSFKNELSEENLDKIEDVIANKIIDSNLNESTVKDIKKHLKIFHKERSDQFDEKIYNLKEEKELNKALEELNKEELKAEQLNKDQLKKAQEAEELKAEQLKAEELKKAQEAEELKAGQLKADQLKKPQEAEQLKAGQLKEDPLKTNEYKGKVPTGTIRANDFNHNIKSNTKKTDSNFVKRHNLKAKIPILITSIAVIIAGAIALFASHLLLEVAAPVVGVSILAAALTSFLLHKIENIDDKNTSKPRIKP